MSCLSYAYCLLCCKWPCSPLPLLLSTLAPSFAGLSLLPSFLPSFPHLTSPGSPFILFSQLWRSSLLSGPHLLSGVHHRWHATVGTLNHTAHSHLSLQSLTVFPVSCDSQTLKSTTRTSQTLASSSIRLPRAVNSMGLSCTRSHETTRRMFGRWRRTQRTPSTHGSLTTHPRTTP